MDYVDRLRRRPIAVETGKANEQHYEVGTGVLQCCLGPRMKVSYLIPTLDIKWSATHVRRRGQKREELLTMP